MPGIPTSQGTLDDNFVNQITKLQTQAAAIADATRLTDQRAWQQPKSLDPLDIKSITEAFVRDDLNENYNALLNDAAKPGTCGDAISLKVQCDYLGIMERGYLTRQATTIRCLAHAAGRRSGHGNTSGIFSERSGALGYAKDARGSGQSTPPYAGTK